MEPMADILRAVDGPFALAGLALLVVGGLIPVLAQKTLDRRTRRAISLGLLMLGGLAIVGSLSLASREAATLAPSGSVHVEGRDNVVGRGNVVGNGNSVQHGGPRERP